MNIIPKFFASLSLSFLLISFSTPSHSQKCNSNDKKVLNQILKALAYRPNFQPLSLPDTSCCDYYGAHCDPQTGRITGLVILDETAVKGRIPEIVGDLKSLTDLSFRNCPNLTGPLPQSLTKLINLSSLWLSSTSLSGPVPSYLSKLKNLEYINLSYNKFSGSIPASLSQLPKLDYLGLNSNKLTGTIPESLGKLALGNGNFYTLELPKLTVLRLDVNKLTGSIPESLGKLVLPSTSIFLGSNLLRGKVPRSFGNADFTSLYFSNNKLEGDISFLFGKNKRLQTEFSRNLVEFDMSKVEFPEKLQTLDLSHNKIYGSIPQQMTKLQIESHRFDLSYNRLCGKIPTDGKLQT